MTLTHAGIAVSNYRRTKRKACIEVILNASSRKLAILEARPRNIVVVVDQASLDLIVCESLVPNFVWGHVSMEGVALLIELVGAYVRLSSAKADGRELPD